MLRAAYGPENHDFVDTKSSFNCTKFYFTAAQVQLEMHFFCKTAHEKSPRASILDFVMYSQWCVARWHSGNGIWLAIGDLGSVPATGLTVRPWTSCSHTSPLPASSIIWYEWIGGDALKPMSNRRSGFTLAMRQQTLWFIWHLRAWWPKTSDALIVSLTRLCSVGDRVFPVSAARVWNGQPAHVTSSPSLHVFKEHLKTVKHFSRSFPTASQ